MNSNYDSYSEKSVFGFVEDGKQFSAAQAELHTLGIGPTQMQNRPPVSSFKDESLNIQSRVGLGALVGGAIGGIGGIFFSILMILQIISFSFLERLSFSSNGLILIIFGLFSGVLLGSSSGALIGIGNLKRKRSVICNARNEPNDILVSVVINDAKSARSATEALGAFGAHDVTILKHNKY